jgi:transposase InsO family protein
VFANPAKEHQARLRKLNCARRDSPKASGDLECVSYGVRVGKERVRKLMAQHGIRARHKRKYIATTNSNHNLPVAPNLLERNFTTPAANQVWTSDITYLATAEGWVYLAVIIDLFSRQVVGWSMQPYMKAELVTDALRMAWFRRRPEAGVIVHSDRGGQYCSGLFRDTLKAYGMRSSMSRRGDCWECADAKPVGFAKGSTYAWTTLHHVACRNGRGD